MAAEECFYMPCPVRECSGKKPCSDCSRLLPLGSDHRWDRDCLCEACCRELQWRLRHEPVAAWSLPPPPVVVRALLSHEFGTTRLDQITATRMARVVRRMPSRVLSLPCECVDWTVPAAQAETEWSTHEEAACEASECLACGRLRCPAGEPHHYQRTGCTACYPIAPDQ